MVCRHCVSTPDDGFYGAPKARLSVTSTCILFNTAIERLGSVLHKHGQCDAQLGEADAKGSLVSLHLTLVNHIEHRRPLAALRVFIESLLWRLHHARPEDKASQTTHDIYLTYGDGGIVKNEVSVLWEQFWVLLRILPRIGESDLLAELFLLCFERQACTFDTAREAIPGLVSSTSAEAIEAAVSVVEEAEPFADEVRVGRLRLREMELKSEERRLDSLSGAEFESIAAQTFEKLGFGAKHLGGAGDYGGDILLNAVDGTRIVVQLKRRSGRVNLKAVQEAHGAVAYYGADLGIVMCTGGFYPSASSLAARCGVELWGRSEITEFLGGSMRFSGIAHLAR